MDKRIRQQVATLVEKYKVIESERERIAIESKVLTLKSIQRVCPKCRLPHPTTGPAKISCKQARQQAKNGGSQVAKRIKSAQITRKMSQGA